MPEGDKVLGVEAECRLEDAAGLLKPPSFVKRLPVNDVPAHVTGLLRKELLADHDCLVDLTRLSKFVRQRREVASRILVELLLQLVDAGGTGHQSLSGVAQAGGCEDQRYPTRGTSQSEVRASLDFSPCRRVTFAASPSRFSSSSKEFYPVLQTMRSSAKVVMWVLLISFVG